MFCVSLCFCLSPPSLPCLHQIPKDSPHIPSPLFIVFHQEHEAEGNLVTFSFSFEVKKASSYCEDERQPTKVSASPEMSFHLNSFGTRG